VTVGPCTVVQIKTAKIDGYDAVQLAYGERKAKNIAKPQLKHTEGLGSFRWMREFRYNFAGRPEDKTEFEQLSRGDVIDASTFAVGDMVNVIGHSKGRGFQGGVKRHGFHGHNTTHGTKDQVRMPGSIGAGEPQHVFKGTRMAGRMGNEQVTVQNLEIIEVNPEDNTILIKGGLPGARNSLVLISGKGELAVKKESSEAVKKETAAEVVEEVKEPVKTENNPPVGGEPEKVEIKKVEVPAEAKAEPASSAGEEKQSEEPKAETKPEIKKEPEVKNPPAGGEKPVEAVIEAVKVEKTKPEPVSAAGGEKPVVAEPAKAAEIKPAEQTEVKPAEPAPKDVYLKMFDSIPKAERERLSSPEAMTSITALEETFKIDMLPILAKLATKEVASADLAAYLVAQLKLEQAKAEEIAKAIKEKKLC
jgi:large subunit ribosomal protein L3